MRVASAAASARLAQAAPELTLRDAPAPAESPETLARLRALSPPPFEPAPPPPPPDARARRAARAGRVRSGPGRRRPATRGPLPQIRFEHATEGFRVLADDTTAVFRNPVIDHTVLVVRRRLAALRLVVRRVDRRCSPARR